MRKYDTVQLFVTCLVDAFYPNAGMSVVEILEKLDFKVEFPETQTCCGQIAFNAGVWEDARSMARHTIDVLYQAEGYIVLPSGSCTDMVTHHYKGLLQGEPGIEIKLANIMPRTFEFTQFLVDECGVKDLGATIAKKVTYHPSCHGLRNLNLSYQANTLLDGVNHLENRSLPEGNVCCGFGGLFAVKLSDISGEMLRRKLDHVASTEADVLVGSDVSCLMHMSGGLRKRGCQIEVKHIAELLVEGLSDDK